MHLAELHPDPRDNGRLKRRCNFTEVNERAGPKRSKTQEEAWEDAQRSVEDDSARPSTRPRGRADRSRQSRPSQPKKRENRLEGMNKARARVEARVEDNRATPLTQPWPREPLTNAPPRAARNKRKTEGDGGARTAPASKTTARSHRRDHAAARRHRRDRGAARIVRDRAAPRSPKRKRSARTP